MQWDVINDNKNKNLRHSVLKTLAAFLNTEGGTLLVGVEDDGTIFGLSNDLKFLEGSLDKFQQLVGSLIHENIGPQYSQFIKLRFESMNGENICVIDVDKSSEPVYMKSSKGKEFFIRECNTSRSLDSEQTVNYVNMPLTATQSPPLVAT